MTPLLIASRESRLDIIEYLVFQKNVLHNLDYNELCKTYSHLDIRLACKDEKDFDLLKVIASELNVNGCKQNYYYHNFNKGNPPLHTACKHHNFQAIKLLRELNCDFTQTNSQGMLPLHIACSYSLDLVQMMVIQNGHVLMCDKDGNTPLHLACKQNLYDVVEYMFSNFPCDFTIQNKNGELPLHLACNAKNLEMVKVVSNCDVNHQTVARDTPLHIACRVGALDIVKYLINECNCDPSLTLKNNDRRLPFHYACAHSLDMVELVDKSFTVEDLILENAYGQCDSFSYVKVTVFEMACSLGLNDIVSYLIKQKLSGPELETDHIALAYACGMLVIKDIRWYRRRLPWSRYEIERDTDATSIHLNTVEHLIIEHGYNPAVSIGYTSLIEYACKVKSLKLMKALTTVSVDIKDSKDNTPLHFACQYDRSDIAKFLMDCECDQTIYNRNGDLALHIACRNSSLEVIRMFKLAKCDLNALTTYGDTPLHIVCKRGQEDIVSYLVNEGKCNVNIPNKARDYALHVACQVSLAIVTRLLHAKCDVNCQDADGNTALHIACYNQLYDIVEYLLKDEQCRADISNRFGDLPLHNVVKYHYYSRIQNEYLQSERDHWGWIPFSHSVERVSARAIMQQVENMTKYRSSHFYDATLWGSWRNTSGKESLRKLQLITMLVNKNDLSVTIANEDQITPVHFAIMSGEVDVLDLFLTKREFTTEDKTALLHFACKYQQKQCVHWLIDHGADCQVTDHHGNLPEHLCIISDQTHKSNDRKCVEILSILGTINVHKKNDVGDTILHLACRKGHGCILQYILSTTDCSDAFTILNNNKDTPLHILASIVTDQLLHTLTKCRDPNVKDSHGNTPLHIACETSNVKFAKLMIELQCDPNISNNKGELPIHLAAAKSLELVKLVSRSDNINAQSKSGNTPLHIACREGNVKVIYFLIETLKCFTNMIAKCSGLTPLHYACTWSMMKVVRLVSDCDPTAQVKINDTEFRMHGVTFSLGDTPLHVACKEGNARVIKYLLKTHKSALNICNEFGELPFHLACQQFKSEKVAQLFVNYKQYFDCNTVNSSGNTPLHIACDTGFTVSFITLMVNQLKCRTDIVNNNGNLPLHIICKKESVCLEAVKVLSAKLNKDMLSKQNSDGNTALHELLKHTNDMAKPIQFLAQIMGNLGISNKDNEMPIHLACHHQKLDLVKNLYQQCRSSIKEPNSLMYEACLNDNSGVLEYIIDCLHTDPNLPNKDGDLPLHIVIRKRTNLANAILLIRKTSNINSINFQGNTPLHELYDGHFGFSMFHYDISKVLNTLLDVTDIDLSVQNLKGQTPLHCICKACRYDDLKLIISRKKPNVNTQDNQGSTPLHIVCHADRLESVRLLLSSAEADPSIKDETGRTPIACTKDPQIIKLLFEYGADPLPLYEMFFESASSKNPPPTPVKLLVIGDPSVGKTTIVHSLRNEGPEHIIPTDGFDHTAGVVTTNFSSKIYGDVKFYDFAGQPEYYSTHDAVLHSTIKNVPPIVLILVKLTDIKKKILNRVHYWINFIENRCAAISNAAHVIVVCSHADVLASQGEDPVEKLKKLHKLIVPEFEDKKLILKNLLQVDCRSNETDKLQELLKTSTNDLREKGVMNFNCHCFYVFLLQTFKDSDFVPLGHVISKVRLLSKNSSNNPLFLLPADRDSIIRMCKDLDDKGHIMFVQHPSDTDMSWIVFDSQLLLHDLLGTLFAPSSFPQHRPLSYSTGVVPLSLFRKYFGKKDTVNMMLAFLTRQEYCREITDKVLLDSIVKQEGYLETEKYYFFPNLVSLDRPDDKWSTGSKYSYQCGWILQCRKESKFFNPHFIQVLLLRLTFAFAPKKVAYDSRDFEDSEDESDEEENQAMALVIKRTCSVWKNGLYWQQSGMKTIIDIIDQRTLVLLMQCHQGRELQLLMRRSMIMSMVLDAKKEFSSKSKVIEYFMHPQCVRHPLTISNISKCRLFSFPKIEQCIINRDPCITNDVDDEIDLQELLLFEPYFEFSTDVIKKLSNEATFHEHANNDLLSTVAGDIDRRYHPLFMNFSHKLGMRITERPAIDEVHQLVCTLKQILKKRKPSGTTCRDVYEFFNQMSIFYGRHPPALQACHEQLSSPRDLMEKDTNDSDGAPSMSSLPKLHQIDHIESNKKVVKVIETVAAKWEKVATRLYFDCNVIDRIKEDHHYQSEPCCRKMFGEWLGGKGRKPVTWQTLITALKEANYSVLASELEDTFHKVVE